MCGKLASYLLLIFGLILLKVSTPINQCFACLEPRILTDELIIPQSIGGRLTDRLYCKECNETFGRTIDKEISSNFGHIGTALQLQRKRGRTQPFKVEEIKSGTQFYFNGQNLKRKKPIVKFKVKENGKTLDCADFTARSKKELNKIMGSLRTKYRMSGNDQRFEERHPGPIDTTYVKVFDTNLIRRAVTKMAYSFLCHKISSTEVLSESFHRTRAYIRSGTGDDLASANFVQTRFMCDYIRPLHKIHINLNRRNCLVVGYVMIFGIYRFTVLLAAGYSSRIEWPCLDYTYDPVSMRVVECNPNFRAPEITEDQILRPKQSKKYVRQELIKGNKILENYIEGYKFLDIEFE